MEDTTQPKLNVLQSVAIISLGMIAIIGVATAALTDSPSARTYALSMDDIRASNPTNVDISDIEIRNTTQTAPWPFFIRYNVGMGHARSPFKYLAPNGDDVRECGVRSIAHNTLNNTLLVSMTSGEYIPSMSSVTECLAVSMVYAKQASEAYRAYQARINRITFATQPLFQASQVK
jgi:hypothetical protein